MKSAPPAGGSPRRTQFSALGHARENGEALAPTFVQLLLDTQERLADAERKRRWPSPVMKSPSPAWNDPRERYCDITMCCWLRISLWEWGNDLGR